MEYEDNISSGYDTFGSRNSADSNDGIRKRASFGSVISNESMDRFEHLERGGGGHEERQYTGVPVVPTRRDRAQNDYVNMPLSTSLSAPNGFISPEKQLVDAPALHRPRFITNAEVQMQRVMMKRAMEAAHGGPLKPLPGEDVEKVEQEIQEVKERKGLGIGSSNSLDRSAKHSRQGSSDSTSSRLSNFFNKLIKKGSTGSLDKFHKEGKHHHQRQGSNLSNMSNDSLSALPTMHLTPSSSSNSLQGLERAHLGVPGIHHSKQNSIGSNTGSTDSLLTGGVYEVSAIHNNSYDNLYYYNPNKYLNNTKDKHKAENNDKKKQLKSEKSKLNRSASYDSDDEDDDFYPVRKTQNNNEIKSSNNRLEVSPVNFTVGASDSDRHSMSSNNSGDNSKAHRMDDVIVHREQKPERTTISPLASEPPKRPQRPPSYAEALQYKRQSIAMQNAAADIQLHTRAPSSERELNSKGEPRWRRQSIDYHGITDNDLFPTSPSKGEEETSFSYEPTNPNIQAKYSGHDTFHNHAIAASRDSNEILRQMRQMEQSSERNEPRNETKLPPLSSTPLYMDMGTPVSSSSPKPDRHGSNQPPALPPKLRNYANRPPISRVKPERHYQPKMGTKVRQSDSHDRQPHHHVVDLRESSPHRPPRQMYYPAPRSTPEKYHSYASDRSSELNTASPQLPQRSLSRPFPEKYHSIASTGSDYDQSPRLQRNNKTPVRMNPEKYHSYASGARSDLSQRLTNSPKMGSRTHPEKYYSYANNTSENYRAQETKPRNWFLNYARDYCGATDYVKPDQYGSMDSLTSPSKPPGKKNVDPKPQSQNKCYRYGSLDSLSDEEVNTHSGRHVSNGDFEYKPQNSRGQFYPQKPRYTNTQDSFYPSASENCKNVQNGDPAQDSHKNGNESRKRVSSLDKYFAELCMEYKRYSQPVDKYFPHPDHEQELHGNDGARYNRFYSHTGENDGQYRNGQANHGYVEDKENMYVNTPARQYSTTSSLDSADVFTEGVKV